MSLDYTIGGHDVRNQLCDIQSTATYADPCKGQFVANLLGFLQKNGELLIAELICREQTSKVANSRLEHAVQTKSDQIILM
jgi:hypothetical protein